MLAFVDGQCDEVTAAEMSSAIEASKPGYMLYALLLPCARHYVDKPFEDMPEAQFGKDIVSVEVLTEFCGMVSNTTAPTEVVNKDEP